MYGLFVVASYMYFINLVIYYNSILYNLVIFFSMEDRNETTCMQGDNIWLYTEDKARHVTWVTITVFL